MTETAPKYIVEENIELCQVNQSIELQFRYIVMNLFKRLISLNKLKLHLKFGSHLTCN